MKKNQQFALLAGLALVCTSCDKAEMPDSGLCEVTFNYGLSGGSPFITKAGESELLLSLTPSEPITLTLQDGNGRTYSVTTGQKTFLHEGIYSVSYMSERPADAQSCGADFYISKKPAMRIQTTITISASKTDYDIVATYLSSALLFDASEVAGVKYQGRTGTQFDINYETGGGLGVMFLTGTLDTPMIMVFIGSEDYKSASLSLVTGVPSMGQTRIEAGKWYFMRLAPNGSPATFGFSLIDWEQGGTIGYQG